MVDAYEVLNADGSESTPLLDLANPYNADGTPNISQKARDFGYVDCSDKMYLNRDPRFYATIYYDGVTVKLENSQYGVETFVGGNWRSVAVALQPAQYLYGLLPAQVQQCPVEHQRRQQGRLYPDVPSG